MRTQLPLKIVDPGLVRARIICRRQQLQPNRILFQSPQPEHPLERHRKHAAALAIFRAKPAPEENGHHAKDSRRLTSRQQSRGLNQRDRLPTVFTVCFEIGVSRENRCVVNQFRHPY